MEPLPPHIAEHIPLYGSRLLRGQENLWKTTWRSYGRFECEFAIWGRFMNTTLRAAVHLGKDCDINLRVVKNYLLENNGTAFQRNRKADQWSDRGNWHKPNQFPRFEVGIDKLIAQSSLSIFHCQGLCLLRLCALWEKWETILLNPGRSKSNGIQKTIISAN